MSSKLYIAYSAYLETITTAVNMDKNLTVCFMDASDVKKLSIPVFPNITCKELHAEYWPESDLTAIVIDDNDELTQIQKCLSSMGYTYLEHAFKPYISMCKGDKVELINMMLSGYTQISFRNPYISIKEFDD